MRLNRAYKPSVKYMDLFADPLVVIVAKNVAFISGSLLAVLLVLTVIQEDLLTAHNVLTVMTMLGKPVGRTIHIQRWLHSLCVVLNPQGWSLLLVEFSFQMRYAEILVISII